MRQLVTSKAYEYQSDKFSLTQNSNNSALRQVPIGNWPPVREAKQDLKPTRSSNLYRPNQTIHEAVVLLYFMALKLN